MIDLHLHTTASDGRSEPAELVEHARRLGLHTIAVTDHDTVAGLEAARAAVGDSIVRVIAGIEITAVERGRDVHVLGYRVDHREATFNGFLHGQQADRRRRLIEMLDALDRLGAPVDRAPLEAAAERPGRAVGRPMVAAALVEAGHARDVADAFDRYVREGQPAFVPRQGTPAADVVGIIHRAGGLASLAHPARAGVDDLIGPLVDAGLDAIEVFHPDHDASARARYRAVADAHGLVVTGGSDYHGPGSGRDAAFGSVTLPAREYSRFVERLRPHRADVAG